MFAASATAPVQHLGFPLSVRLTPITGTVGYRFRRNRSFVPYVGVGGGVTRYREESEVAGESFSESRSAGTFVGEGGVEYGKGRFRYAVEGSYSIASGAVGLGGISEVYGEDDVGGWAVVGKVVYTFGKRPPPPRRRPSLAAARDTDTLPDGRNAAYTDFEAGARRAVDGWLFSIRLAELRFRMSPSVRSRHESQAQSIGCGPRVCCRSHRLWGVVGMILTESRAGRYDSEFACCC